MLFRSGFCAIIGAPNAGKSTLINALVGSKVAIVSPKVQTTRMPVRGIAIAGQTQIIFVDTPGIFRPRRRLDRAMVTSAWSGAEEADAVLLIVDANDLDERAPAARDTMAILEGLKERKGRKVALVLNKIDGMKRTDLASILVFVLCVGAVPLVTQSGVWLNFAMMGLYACLLAQAWNILGGFGGQFSFGHAVFFGTGAYASLQDMRASANGFGRGVCCHKVWCASLSHGVTMSKHLPRSPCRPYSIIRGFGLAVWPTSGSRAPLWCNPRNCSECAASAPAKPLIIHRVLHSRCGNVAVRSGGVT